MVKEMSCITVMVRGQVPRKQGLKRADALSLMRASVVRGQVPSKQGLKHSDNAAKGEAGYGPRASSKKTRIETERGAGRPPGGKASEGKFQENKD